MKILNVITGGLLMSNRSLLKYKQLYTGDTVVIPLQMRCIVLPANYYKKYKIIKTKFDQYDGIRLHALSGSCHFLVNMFDMYPDIKSKIISQIYDSPCHVKGISNFFECFYNVPPTITNIATNTIFRDCKRTSEQFMNNPLIEDISTGVIYSDHDLISPAKTIEAMIDKWSPKTQLNILKTSSNHVESLRDKSEEYQEFVNQVLVNRVSMDRVLVG